MLQLAAHTAAAVRPPKEALDVQVLDGLETFLATERFLGKLEAARAEWMDLSHAATDAAAHAAHAPPHGGALAAAAAAHAHPAAHAPASDAGASSDDEAYAAARSEDGGGVDSGSTAGGVSAASGDALGGPGAGGAHLLGEPPLPPLPTAAVGDFVVINRDDAVEAMAYYIAMYISRLPEAQRMGPKELQAALKDTFAALRRSKWRLVWAWGRALYRGAAVSFSALQLYQNPWLARAALSALWASSRLLYAQLA